MPSDGEAHDLLALRLGPDRLTGEPDAVGELIELTARLPLALSIAALTWARGLLEPRTRAVSRPSR